MFGYNHAVDMATITPMFGVKYTRVNSGSYKESGSATGQNLSVSSKATNQFDVVAGARIAARPFKANGMSITPEIHAFATHDLISKSAKQTAKLEGTSAFGEKSNKLSRTTYNVGVGVSSDYGMMEYGAGYDATFAEKRLGHTGSLRLRVNF